MYICISGGIWIRSTACWLLVLGDDVSTFSCATSIVFILHRKIRLDMSSWTIPNSLAWIELHRRLDDSSVFIVAGLPSRNVSSLLNKLLPIRPSTHSLDYKMKMFECLSRTVKFTTTSRTIFAYLNKRAKYSWEFLHKSITALSSNCNKLIINIWTFWLLCWFSALSRVTIEFSNIVAHASRISVVEHSSK